MIVGKLRARYSMSSFSRYRIFGMKSPSVRPPKEKSSLQKRLPYVSAQTAPLRVAGRNRSRAPRHVCFTNGHKFWLHQQRPSRNGRPSRRMNPNRDPVKNRASSANHAEPPERRPDAPPCPEGTTRVSTRRRPALKTFTYNTGNQRTPPDPRIRTVPTTTAAYPQES